MSEFTPDALGDGRTAARGGELSGTDGRSYRMSTLIPSPWPRDDERSAPSRGPGRERRNRLTEIGDYVERLVDRITIGHRGAMGIAGLGLLLVLIIGAAGPNAATVHVRGPLSFLPTLPTWPAYILVETSIVLEMIGFVLMLRATNRGWRPNPWKLFALGTAFIAIMVNLSPVGSSDSASYAAYGAMYNGGHDVYSQGPISIGAPYAPLVDIRWLNTPSVYGPFATWLQALAAWFGSGHPTRTIWFLMVVNALAFVAIGALLIRFCKNKVRAALFWAANPLLIHQIVAGGHLDTFVAGFGVCALLVARRYALAGAFVSLGSGFKMTAGLFGGGFAIDRFERRDWSGLARVVTAGVVVFLLVYSIVGVHAALQPFSNDSGLVSFSSPWHLLTWTTGFVLGSAGSHTLVQICWPLAFVILAAKLRNHMPVDASPLLRIQFALAFAWILVAPWVLPWYTAPVWAIVTMLPKTRLVGWLIAYSFLLAVLHASGGTPAGYYRGSMQERVSRTVSISDGSGAGSPPPLPRLSQWSAASARPNPVGAGAGSFAAAV